MTKQVKKACEWASSQAWGASNDPV